MPEELKAWQVRHAAHEVVWHIRLARLLALEHTLGPLSCVAALLRMHRLRSRSERARDMNIISGACVRLIRLLTIVSGQEGRHDPDGVS